jgi:N-acetylglutamate synthase-like GNAT family acetyltransferase
MVGNFQECNIRDANTLKLRWRIYRFLYGKNPLFLSGLLLGGVVLLILVLQHQRLEPVIIWFVGSCTLSFLLTHLALSFQVLLSGSSRHPQRTWMLEKRGRLIAIASLQFQQSYSTLVLLEVDKSYRGQGFGSYLVQQLCLNVPKPIYVVPRPQSINFYQKNGFSICSVEQCPKTLKQSFGKVLVRR